MDSEGFGSLLGGKHGGTAQNMAVVVEKCSQYHLYDSKQESSDNQGQDRSFKGSPLKAYFYQIEPTSQSNDTSWKTCILNKSLIEDVLNLVLVTFSISVIRHWPGN